MSIPLQAIVLLVVFVLLAMALWGIFVAQCRGWLRLIDMWSRPDHESEGRGMSHTPGPWKILRHDLGDEEICSVPVEIRGGNGRLVVADEGGLAPAAYEWTAEEIEANASLIAAAPELLEALKRLEYQSEVSLESADPARVAARKAIAKARGEK